MNDIKLRQKKQASHDWITIWFVGGLASHNNKNVFDEEEVSVEEFIAFIGRTQLLSLPSSKKQIKIGNDETPPKSKI